MQNRLWRDSCVDDKELALPGGVPSASRLLFRSRYSLHVVVRSISLAVTVGAQWTRRQTCPSAAPVPRHRTRAWQLIPVLVARDASSDATYLPGTYLMTRRQMLHARGFGTAQRRPKSERSWTPVR